MDKVRTSPNLSDHGAVVPISGLRPLTCLKGGIPLEEAGATCSTSPEDGSFVPVMNRAPG